MTATAPASSVFAESLAGEHSPLAMRVAGIRAVGPQSVALCILPTRIAGGIDRGMSRIADTNGKAQGLAA
ncbi:MAG: hypothetical protein ACAH65_10550 [Chloroflexota bacterium]